MQVYGMMKECWQYNFTERPCFSLLGNQIEAIMQDERDNFKGWWTETLSSPVEAKYTSQNRWKTPNEHEFRDQNNPLGGAKSEVYFSETNKSIDRLICILT